MTNPFSVQPGRLNRPDHPALWLNIALWVGAVLLINGLVYGLGWDTSDEPTLRPPAVDLPVGLVWIGLFVGMAIARWLLNGPALTNPSADNARWWLSVLLLNCLIYPFYSLAVDSIYGGLAGNGVVLLLVVYILRQTWPIDRRVAWLTGLVGGWVVFATYLIFTELGWV